MKYIKYGAIIIWMLVIFLFSNQSSLDSTNTSNEVILKVASFISTDYNEKVILEDFTFVTRKTAHLTLYLILGVLVINAATKKDKNTIIVSIFICLLYACSDEIHQLFISGRSGEIRDVFIDTLGSILGIILYKVLFNKVQNRGIEYEKC